MQYEVTVEFKPVLRGTIVVDAESEDEARTRVADLPAKALIARCTTIDVATLSFLDLRKLPPTG
ncbi:MAG: hypothetical protein KF696_01045 [Planctomycetes bacterium]|nr:hypothetical protein [Planctomycetota bacterium]MCW8134474.1 hypothetical protein [Planctomycetota bacterium]